MASREAITSKNGLKQICWSDIMLVYFMGSIKLVMILKKMFQLFDLKISVLVINTGVKVCKQQECYVISMSIM